MLTSPPPGAASGNTGDTPAGEAGRRADIAARSVTTAYGHRLLGIPGTHIGAVECPGTVVQSVREWHYWWQAHYLDALVDAGHRELAAGTHYDGASRPSAGRLASRLLTTIRIRNYFRYRNWFYDDMAWLALAAGRLDRLAADARKPDRRRNARAQATLGRALDSAHTPDLGGGLFWNTKRDFKNTPATAPAALFFAKNGDSSSAQDLVDWLNAYLLDADRGLYLDGLKLSGGETTLEPAVYSYNQGPVLGALLELGAAENLDRAAGLIASVADNLSVDGVLLTHGRGDGGLFTGILMRYLALAANSNRLPNDARNTAADLVTNTAAAFWAGRCVRTVRPGTGARTALFARTGTGARRTGTGARRERRTRNVTIFSADPRLPAEQTYPAGAAVELSTQLQAWMALEAAATLGPDGAQHRSEES